MTKQKYLALAEISERMDEDLILVGGGAVEFYSDGWYVSGDLDIITTNRRKLASVLLELGYERLSERHYLNGGIFIDIVGSYFDRRSDEIAIKGTGLSLRVISLEDIILDRLCACVHWVSNTDCEQAGYLLSAFQNKLDMNYLMKRATEDEVLDKLEELLNEINAIKARTKKKPLIKPSKKTKNR